MTIDTTTASRPPRRPRRETVDYGEIGRRIVEETLGDLPERYARARREDRKQLLCAAVDQIVATGVAADLETGATYRERLKRLGEQLPKLVLHGTFEQQFACKLARYLAAPRAVALPRSVIECIVEKLADALIAVLTLGAPTTRDAAVEGLGGLLKLLPNPAGRFPLLERLPVPRNEGEDDDSYGPRVRISENYFERLERRRLMVLTIAEDQNAQQEFCRRLAEPITTRIERLCASDSVPWDEVENVLYAHPDLLRILPAVARQQSNLAIDSAALLCDAARLLAIDVTAPDPVAIAFARFQESVFRTLDTAMRRDKWNWAELDGVIAAAVQRIPRSTAGAPAMCNAQIRTTVAILRTAIRFIGIADTFTSTKASLKPLFESLGDRRPWTNLGIFEGCFRSLPELLTQSRHDDLADLALQSLCDQLSQPRRLDDLAEVHRHVVASSCFRRILASVMDAGYGTSRDVEASVRVLLRDPTPENIVKAWRGRTDPEEMPPNALVDVAQPIIASVAFESELLGLGVPMCERWREEPTWRKVLLIRILASEMHTLARETPELQRHPLLCRVFTGIDTVTLSDAKAMKTMWTLLSSLPPDAAEAADAEIQRFVEYRGKSSDDRVNDLPGYVLAMISTSASGRIAGAIAREIDLHLRLEESHARPPDFAKLLYHVTLRGPHQSIFDHLLPRVRDDHDRNTVLLFRRHVARVLASRKDERDAEFDMPHILTHVRQLRVDLVEHLRQGPSPTLGQLRQALDHFINLTQDSERVWKALTTGEALAFIDCLDELAKDEAHREPLSAFHRNFTDLQDDVSHYLALAIGNFEERKETLTTAGDLAASIEERLRTHEGLQPPERTIVITLLRHLRKLFDDTKRWACDEAAKIEERGDKDRFWLFFCDPRTKEARIGALVKIVRTAMFTDFQSDANIKRLAEQIESAPPPFGTQRGKFEEYFVEWMTSELDVETLKRVLRKRWPFYFRGIYAITTRFWLTSLTIITPFAIAAWLDARGKPELAGIGFFAMTLAMIVAGVFSFTRVIHWIASWFRDEDEKEQLSGYWFPCLIPRLARLTAVPMALIVEFDHSYEFPLHASTWALLLLAAVSFLTTRFFVTREMVDREERPGIFKVTPEERKHVWQIVAVALSHSFGIAVILSVIFAAGHQRKVAIPEDEPSVHTVAGTPAPFWSIPEEILERIDEIPQGQVAPRFLGLIPRKVTLDFGVIAENANYPLPPKVAEHAIFRFYPTIIFAWTALGLFFGVFLEGFMKGERLRGRPADEQAVSSAA